MIFFPKNFHLRTTTKTKQNETMKLLIFLLHFLLILITNVIGELSTTTTTTISSTNDDTLTTSTTIINNYVPVENSSSSLIINKLPPTTLSTLNLTTDSNANVYNGIADIGKDPMKVDAQQQNPFMANRGGGSGGGGGINPQIAMLLRNNPRLQLLAQQNPVIAQQIMRNPQLLRDPIIQSKYKKNFSKFPETFPISGNFS